MKLRLIEEFCPVRNNRIWWVERRLPIGLWWPVPHSVTSDTVEARFIWSRIKSLGPLITKRTVEFAHSAEAKP